jgi:hypothetical protein
VIATYVSTWGSIARDRVRSVTRALWQNLAFLLSLLLSRTFGSVLGQTRLELFRSLHLALLRVRLSSLLARRRIASQGPTIGLLLEELVEDALPVRVEELVWDAHHAEDFGLNVLATFDGVVDGSEGLLVNLLQVNLQTTSGVEAAIAVVTLEVLCFLVRDEDFLVVKVALAVVAPRARDEVLDIGTVALFLVHHGCGGGGVRCGWGGGGGCEDVGKGVRRRDEDSRVEGASRSGNLVIAGLARGRLSPMRKKESGQPH